MQSLLMPPKDVAHLVGVTVKTVTFWAENPAYADLEFPKPIRIKTNKFYDRAEIEAWIERRKAERGNARQDPKARENALAANRASVAARRQKKIAPASKRWAHG